MPELDPNIALPIAVLMFLIGFPLFLILFLAARRRAKRLGRQLNEEKTRAAKDRARILAEEKSVNRHPMLTPNRRPKMTPSCTTEAGPMRCSHHTAQPRRASGVSAIPGS